LKWNFPTGWSRRRQGYGGPSKADLLAGTSTGGIIAPCLPCPAQAGKTKNLETEVRRLLGNAKLKDLNKRVLIPAFDPASRSAMQGKPGQPAFAPVCPLLRQGKAWRRWP
jgi:patatin-like phospholipase/acyl hydrolase